MTRASQTPDGGTGPAADRPDCAAWRVCAAAAGVALLLIGLGGIAAAADGHPEYVQIDPAFPPLHPVSAAGFALCGLGCLALARGRCRAARALGSALAVGALAALVAAVSGARLDPWPAGVAPGAFAGLASGLCLAGVTLALTGRSGGATGRVLPVLAGVALLLAGPVALVSARSGESLLGALGAGVAGLAMLASVFRKGVPVLAVGRALPALVGFTGVVLTAVLWAGMNTEQEARLYRQVQFETDHAHRTARDRLLWHFAILARAAERWEQSDPARRQDDAGRYVGATPGCVGLARVERDRTLTWLEYRQGKPPATLADVGVADTLGADAREGRTGIDRPPRSQWRGARMLVVYAPERPGVPGSPGLIAVYRLQEFLGAILNENVAAGYAVSVADGSEVLYSRQAPAGEGSRRWVQTLPLPVQAETWRVEVWPTEEVLDREHLSKPRLALAVGLVTTALLTLAVHLAQTARRRARALEAEIRGRESAQRALAQSEEKYRTLIEHLAQAVFLQDRDGRFVAANSEFCRGLGRAEAEIVGRTESELFDAGSAAAHAEEVRTVLSEGKCVESEEELGAAGARRVVRRVLTPVRDAAGQTVGVLGICWDVTAQRLLEAQVQQASKMDAIGQLAGGIAHDFNNILTAILGNLELVLAGLPDGEPARGPAADALNAATRAGSLTKRLLGFARPHRLDWVPIDLNAVVQEVVALVGRTIDPRIKIEMRCAAQLLHVRGDPAQLNQVLMNLCLNARDAIGGAGRITVETAFVASADLHRSGGSAPMGGEFVRLSVTDTGCGMTEEVRARMYEPFFTTKEVGKGTGLGLAMVFATVRQHKGWIDCRSEVGCGTRFDVYLPRGGGGRPAEERRHASAPVRIARETVLVVDDEEMVRGLAVATLRQHGYRVLEAGDGQQALDAYAREGDRIDLVLLDLTMPVLSGHEAFRHLTRLNPRVRVVFASGYAAEQLTDLEKELMAGFLAKPYRPSELLTVVEDALHRGGKCESNATEPDSRDPAVALVAS